MSHQGFKHRLLIVNLGILLLFPLIIFQLFHLTIQDQNRLLKYADAQHNLVIEIPPERGLIYDRNMKPFTTNLKVPSIYAVPRLLTKSEKSKMVETLAPILNLDRKFLASRLGRNKAFVWLKRRTNMKEAGAVEALKNPALGVTYEKKRFYPHGTMFANVLGFCNIDTKGVDGLELLYDHYMTGKPGFRYTKRDARGREIVALEKKLVPAVDGSNVVLTIDQYVQFLTDQALDEAMEKWHAKSAVAIVMNPKTGEILAMSSKPTFNPNDPGEADAANRRNRTITDIFEPGSVFKIVTVASALQDGVVQMSDTFNCEQGKWQVRPNRVIHDVHPYGVLDLSGVLIKSSNIGTVKVAMKLGEKKLYEHIKQFQFGELTGIDFPGEVKGIIRPVSQWSKFSISSIPYGQEVAATAIQMVRAISVIANGGYLAKPYLLKQISDPQGVMLLKREPVISAPILSEKVTAMMRGILERVVSEGTGKSAAIDGIKVAGKTGTSQKLNPGGGYSHSKFVGSFIGFAPADDPKLAMIVSIDEPHPLYYGGTVAAPVFSEVIEQSLLYMGYVPAKGKSPEALSEVKVVTSQNSPSNLRPVVFRAR